MSQEAAALIGTACHICQKDLDLEGKIMDYAEAPAGSVLIVVICPSCGARYCPVDHAKELGVKLFRLSGGLYDNAVCPNCGHSMKAAKVILKPGSEKIAPKPKGVYLEAKEVPESCPACGGNQVSAIRRPQRRTWNDLALILGLGMIVAVITMNATGTYSEKILYLFLLLSIWFIWEGLTNRPFPILNKYFVNPPTTLHARCNDCGNAWQVSPAEKLVAKGTG